MQISNYTNVNSTANIITFLLKKNMQIENNMYYQYLLK